MRYSTTADLIEKWLPLSVLRAKDSVEIQIAHVMSWTYFQISSRRVTLARWGIPILILLLAYPLGELTNRSQEINEMLPYLLIGLLFLPVVLMIVQQVITRYEWSPVMILFAAIFVPIQLPTGTASVVVDSLLIALIFTGNWIMQMIIIDKRLTLKPSPLNKPFWGFAIITIISLIWSLFFRDPMVDVKGNFPVVQAGSAVVNIILVITMLLVANHINQRKQLHIMVIMMLVAGFLGILSRFGGVSFLAQFVNDNGLFTMWVAALGVSLFLFNRKLVWPWRLAALGVGASIQLLRFYWNITWLAGWLPGFIALGVVVFSRSKLLLMLSIAVAIMFILININMLQEAYELESERSGDTRELALQYNWSITSKHWFLGTGQAAYINYYNSYNIWPMATHNTVADVLAQNGIFGLFFFMWLMIALLLVNYKTCIRLSGQGNFAEAIANAVFAGTVSSFITAFTGDWLFPFAYTQTISGYDYIVYSWLFMGVNLAINRLYLSPKRHENQPATPA